MTKVLGKAVSAKNKKRRYLVILKSGERIEFVMENEKKLQKWLATGAAGLVTRSRHIRLSPDLVKEIVDITEDDEKNSSTPSSTNP